MGKNTEYKILSHCCTEIIPPQEQKYGEIDIILNEILTDYGESLSNEISSLPGNFDWQVVSHSVSFVNNHPVITILLRHD